MYNFSLYSVQAAIAKTRINTMNRFLPHSKIEAGILRETMAVFLPICRTKKLSMTYFAFVIAIGLKLLHYCLLEKICKCGKWTQYFGNVSILAVRLYSVV